MGARSRPRPPQSHDVLDLRERQTEPAPLTDKSQDAQNVVRVDAIAGRGTARWRENAARLI